VGAKQFLVQSITWVARPENQSAFDEGSPPHTDFITRSTVEMETIVRDAASKKKDLRRRYCAAAGFTAPMRPTLVISARSFWRANFPSLVRVTPCGNGFMWTTRPSAFVTVAESERGGLWHVTDDQPVSAGRVSAGFAQRLGAPAPRHVPVWLAKILAGPVVVNLMTASTRTSNVRCRRDFDWQPRFPSYREALDQIVGEWRRENFLGLRGKIAA